MVVRQYVRSRRHLRDKLGPLAMFWPPSKGIMERLALYLGDGLKRQEVPLLYTIIDRAVDAFFALPPHPRRQRYATFLHKCAEEATIMLCNIAVVQGRREWHVAGGEPMLVWYGSAPGGLRVRPHPSTAQTRRQAMSVVGNFLADENRFVLSGHLKDLGSA